MNIVRLFYLLCAICTCGVIYSCLDKAERVRASNQAYYDELIKKLPATAAGEKR